MWKNLLSKIKEPYLISKEQKGLFNAKKFYNSLASWQRFLGFNYRKILPKSASAILIFQITSLESVFLICSSKEEQMYRLQCLIKLKASPWGNWNFYQRGDRPGYSCSKEVPYKAKWKAVIHHWWYRAIEHGDTNWNPLHRTFHYMLGTWPWNFRVSLVYKKSSDVKIIIQMVNSLALNEHSYREI